MRAESISYLSLSPVRWALDGASIIAGSLFLALAAQIAVPLPFTPVPLTGQTLAVMLLGVFLGPRKAALAVMTYLAEGFFGLPVFSNALSGPAVLFGPRLGYFAGMIAQAYLAGVACQNYQGFTRFLLLAASSLLQLATGALWLANFVGFAGMLPMGLLPFLPGEAIKVCAVQLLTFKKKSAA